MTMTPEKTFWTHTGRYGVIHRPAPENQREYPGCLIVFVHGIFGNCMDTWGHMPRWVLESCPEESDIASFSYPAQVWQRTGVSQAAEDLRTWLETELGGYRHLVFVTHSSGGLVVKHLLTEAFREIEAGLADRRFDFASSNSVWLRTRRVINIAVPHLGGSPLPSIGGLIAYCIVYPLIFPLLKMVRFTTQGSKDWGWNAFIATLTWQNPWLLRLDRRFEAHLGLAERWDLPYPVVTDIYAKSDLSVPIAAERGQRHVYFRGTHGSVKIPTQASDPIIVIVSDIVRRYISEVNLSLVDLTLARIAQVNQVAGIDHLIDTGPDSQEPPTDRPTSQMGAAVSGTQAEIRDAVLETIQRGGERPRQLVVTGAAGVGKSAVLRMIGWRFGRAYLENPGPETPLPLLVPLQQVNLDDNGGMECSWECLWQWWLDWAKNLEPNMPMDFSWLERRFASQASVVIFDGIDDFLINNPTIGLSTLIRSLREAARRYADNPRLTVVIGIRSGFPGLERLADDPRHLFEILRLTPAEARRQFPESVKWLAHIQDPGLLDLALTPLILSNFTPDTRFQSRSGALTQTSIMDETLRTIVRRSHLTRIGEEENRVVDIDHLMYALSLIAWIFFQKSRGEINASVLCKEAGEICRRWERFFYDHDLLPQAESLMSGFRLVEEPQLCNALLQRTVFIATGPETVRFSHRSWQEFLLAHYFSLCLKWGHVHDFGVTAFNSRIYRMAGELCRDMVVTEKRLSSIIEYCRSVGNTYVSGNLIAFLAWTHVSIETQALRGLLDKLPDFEALSRIVLIAGLGYRILVNSKEDRSLTDLRRSLAPKLREFSDPAIAPVDDPVAWSLAWCYRKAFASMFHMPVPDIPWPEIGFGDNQAKKALPMICKIQGDERIVDARSRSLQMAFLSAILDAYADPHLVIRAVHYLYYLVVALKYDVHVFEISQELPRLLAPGSRFEQIVMDYTAVPELLTLYRKYQAVQKEMDLPVF